MVIPEEEQRAERVKETEVSIWGRATFLPTAEITYSSSSGLCSLEKIGRTGQEHPSNIMSFNEKYLLSSLPRVHPTLATIPTYVCDQIQPQEGDKDALGKKVLSCKRFNLTSNYKAV